MKFFICWSNRCQIKFHTIKFWITGFSPIQHYPSYYIKLPFNYPTIIPLYLMEKVFKENNWSNSWRNGIYTYNHYHSITHEVLGVYSGDCHILLGGHSGIQILIEKGDVLIIPAGVAHKNIGCSIDFKCVGAYPNGKDFDINLGKSGERPGTDKNIRKVPVPKKDPIYGKEG